MRSLKSKALPIVLLLLVIGFATSGEATIYYVSPQGSDSYPGTETSPWCTLAFAADRLQPGDSLVVKEGRYVLRDFGEDMITPPSGIEDAWITIRGEEGNIPVIVGENDLFAALDISGVSYLRLENLEITSNGREPFREGISAGEPASHLVLKDLYIHHLDEFGIDLATWTT